MPDENNHNGISESFFALTPDRVLAAVEAGGVNCTGLCYPLNSLENRVYELEREDRSRVVAKFYRPGRWSLDALRDEHVFLKDLAEAEVPVATPIVFEDGDTLHSVEGIHYALFSRVGGRAPDELTDEQLRRLGALLGRIHNVGASASARHRRVLSAHDWARESLDVLRSAPTLAPTLRDALTRVTDTLIETISPRFEGVSTHRIHGDCHLGNLLFGSEGPFFLDFDDMAVGPAVQDVWLLTPGRDEENSRQREVLLANYETFRAFDRTTLALVEPLRALRYLHYAAWITRRWRDPAFPRAFPQYGTHTYWAELVADLEEQLGRITESPPVTKSIATGESDNGSPSPSHALRITEVAFGSDDFLRVLMLRDEVFTEELGRDPTAGLDGLDGLDGTSTHLLARGQDTKPIGTARVNFHLRTARVTHLAVLAHHRHHGVATALVRHAVETARTLGASAITLDQSAPQGLCTALGFSLSSTGWSLELQPERHN